MCLKGEWDGFECKPESIIIDMRCILKSALYHKNMSSWTIDKGHC